ncbi:MAG: RNA polymerase sigma factor SigM [Actinomycetes bacterium]|nr:RNA polymerase sigma factor SigM [Acidimicrobiia bacterium]
MKDLPDPDLLARAARGDRAAFDELMRRHEDRVFAICLRIVRDREVALDTVQDTFLTVFRKAGQFRGESQFSTWLYRVAVNTCYDHLRRRKRRPTEPLPEGFEPPDRHVDSALSSVELRPDLTTALASLSEEFRTTLVLADVEGFPIGEVARILDVAEGTVKSRLHRARKELARILGNREAWG